MRLATLLACALVASPVFAQSTAQYRVTFESTWSAQTHPVAWPGPSAHYSPLVGATHATAGALWSPGGIATDGIEQMAETGGTSMLTGEINALRASGEVHESISGGALATTPNSLQTEFSVRSTHPLVSLVTMVAPSPDWFVGTNGVDLRDGDGWRSELVVELHVWDAGTDSGPAYTSPNQDTQPREPIQISDAAPFADGNTILGSFRFELLSVVSADGAPESGLTVGEVVPTPSAGRAALSVTLPQPADVTLDVIDVLGRTVATARHGLGAGRAELSLPVSGLAPGRYAVRVRTPDATVVRRLVLTR